MIAIDSILTSIKAKVSVGLLLTISLNIIGKDYLAYEILFVLVAIDTLTGFLKAIKNKNVSSKRFMKTGYKLLLYFLLILASHQLTRYQSFLIWLEEFIVIFLAVTEMISIIENVHVLGIPIPTWVTQKLETYVQKPLINKEEV